MHAETPGTHAQLGVLGRTAVSVLLSLAMLLGWAAVTSAAPGENGKIAYQSEGEIYTINSDGSGLKRLTSNSFPDSGPVWSPDGTRLGFTRRHDSTADGYFDVFVMNADGSGETRLTTNPFFDADPAWSPDGARIAFMSDRSTDEVIDNDGTIYVMNADGSGQTRLTDGTSGGAAWSPDGSRIAFVHGREEDWAVWVMNADGSGVVRVGGSGYCGRAPAWSPDGARIAFLSSGDYSRDPDVVVVNVDGRGGYWVTDSPGAGHCYDGGLAWSRDGSTLAFSEGTGIYLVNADGSGLRLAAPAGAWPAWSPDGRQLTFRRDGAIYVMNADGSGEPLRIASSTDGNNLGAPAWQPKPCTIVGTQGGDRLIGTSGNDVICGFGGNDVPAAAGTTCCAAGSGTTRFTAMGGATG